MQDAEQVVARLPALQVLGHSQYPAQTMLQGTTEEALRTHIIEKPGQPRKVTHRTIHCARQVWTVTRGFKEESVSTQRVQGSQLFHVGVRAHPVKRPRVGPDQSSGYVGRGTRLANPAHLVTGLRYHSRQHGTGNGQLFDQLTGRHRIAAPQQFKQLRDARGEGRAMASAHFFTIQETILTAEKYFNPLIKLEITFNDRATSR